MSHEQLRVLLEILIDEAADKGMQGKLGYHELYRDLNTAMETFNNRPRHCHICNSGVCDHVW